MLCAEKKKLNILRLSSFSHIVNTRLEFHLIMQKSSFTELILRDLCPANYSRYLIG